MLDISEQTLRRRLQLEGIHYQQIKDSLRLNTANTLLSNKALSIASIGKQLDFSEPRAFTRAYKNWTGLSPKEYRNKELKRKQ